MMSYDTGTNAAGLCAVSEWSGTADEDPKVAFPVMEEGSLQITNVKAAGGVIIAACVQLQ